MNPLRSLFLLAGLGAAVMALGNEPTAPTPVGNPYPLTTCVVSGDKLGESGPPVKYMYKRAGQPDRVVEFCCKDCIKDFEKDPAKYLAVLDAASAGHAAAMSRAGSMNSCPASMADCSGCSAAKAMDAGATGAANKSGAGDTLLRYYIPVSEALAADDLGAAKSSALTLAKAAGTAAMQKLGAAANAVAGADSLQAARDAFKALSSEMEPLTRGASGFVVMRCPMVRADWIQTDPNVRNPYLGKAMLTCGVQKKS